MTWFKVDDQLAIHPKAIAAGNSAMGLWVRAGSWCGAHLTGGALPKHMVGTLGAQLRDAKRLVEVGLWDATDVGYQFRGWDEYQPAKSQVEAKRVADRERKRRWRESKSHADGHAVTPSGTDAVTDAVSHASPDPTRPDHSKEEEPKGSSMPPNRGTRLPDDWQPSPALVAYVRSECPTVDGRAETENFRDYWHAKSGKDATKRDWDATFRRWMRTARDRQNNGRPVKRRPHTPGTPRYVGD